MTRPPRDAARRAITKAYSTAQPGPPCEGVAIIQHKLTAAAPHERRAIHREISSASDRRPNGAEDLDVQPHAPIRRIWMGRAATMGFFGVFLVLYVIDVERIRTDRLGDFHHFYYAA